MYAQIIVNITSEAVQHAYTYLVPEGLSLKVGDKVRIPFGKQQKTGYVIGLSDFTDYPEERIREISCVEEKAISMKEQLIEMAVFLSKEYGTSLNQCLKTVLPVKRSIRKTRAGKDAMAGYRRLAENEDAGGKDRVLQSAATSAGEAPGETPPLLNPEQKSAVRRITASFRRCCTSAEHRRTSDTEEAVSPPEFLLFGVTGSGKTEVYLEAMEEVIRAGKQVILLIPEISLALQTISRVETRFPGRCAVLHSRMSQGERYREYCRCEQGEVDILIGPRSAIFVPFPRLGMIFMDEEQDSAYQSEMAPRYHSWKLCRKRAELCHCPVVYGSATPSVSLYQRARAGEIELLRLPRRARRGSVLPKTEIIDMRQELEAGNRSIFSRRLQELMQEKLQKKEQILLFLNRRGYSNFVSCRSCGEVIRCPHCDVSLTLHKNGTLVCHYCGYTIPVMHECPSCGSRYLAPFGIGTERLELMTRELFPKARILRMDADTTGRKYGHEKILQSFREQKADILIGTQMIVKGHDFPNVTLVGLMAADLSMNLPEYQAEEKTFQLLTQATGRAGRGEKEGYAILQTYQPEHPTLLLSKTQDYEAFFEQEMQFRKQLGYPPLKGMLTIQLSSSDEALLGAYAKESLEAVRPDCDAVGCELFGPFAARVYKLKDIYRKIIYMKHEDHDIILQLRDRFLSLLRGLDRRGRVLCNFDYQD